MASDYKGLHGYATKSEQIEAWNKHLDQMCHEERKTVVIQMLRKTPGRRMIYRDQFWPQLLPALDEMVRDGEVRCVNSNRLAAFLKAERHYEEGTTTRSSTYAKPGGE